MQREDGTYHSGVSRIAHLGTHGPPDGVEVGDVAIVHARVSPKDKRMVVDVHNGGARRGPDVSKTHPCLRVGADGSEVDVVDWRRDRLVRRGTQTFFLAAVAGRPSVSQLKVGCAGRVPCHAHAVDVHHTVTCLDQRVFIGVAWVVGDQTGKIVLVDLLHESMFRDDEYVFEQTGFGG